MNFLMTPPDLETLIIIPFREQKKYESPYWFSTQKWKYWRGIYHLSLFWSTRFPSEDRQKRKMVVPDQQTPVCLPTVKEEGVKKKSGKPLDLL